MAMDVGGTAGSRLARSYFGGPLGEDGFDVAFTYDNALAIIALVGRGEPDDIERATALADGILFAQETDPEGDGRIRDGYTPDPFRTPERTANIAFDFGQSGTSVGNMAWAAIALCHLAAVDDGEVRARALAGAVKLATWVEANTFDATGPGGYRFGLLPDGPLVTKSIEHNIDLVAVFTMLDGLDAPVPDATPAWLDRRAHALGLVEAMWNADGGHFWTGTTDDLATPNPAPIPEDAQTWSYLALLDDRYAASIDWCGQNLAVANDDFTGVSFSDADTSRVWFEGTAHLACALIARDRAETRETPGDAEAASALLESIRLAQSTAPNADGTGITAASAELDTGFGFSYFPSLHLGATAWYLMATLGVNPFQLPDAT